MSFDEEPITLPKLYGAPPNPRPVPVPVEAVTRPFDPDQFPLDVEQTDEERESMAFLSARTYQADGSDRRGQGADGSEPGSLTARAFRLRAIAGRLLGGD